MYGGLTGDTGTARAREQETTLLLPRLQDVPPTKRDSVAREEETPPPRLWTR